MTDREEMTSTQRILHLKLILEANEWRHQRVNKSAHRSPHAKHYAQLLWEPGVLDVAALSRLLGCSRQTIYTWVPRDGVKRLRGPKDFDSLQYLLTALQTRAEGHKVAWGQVTGDLRASGVPPTLLRFLCGPGKTKIGAARTESYYAKQEQRKKEYRERKRSAPAPVRPPEEASRDSDDLRTEVRPDDQGHTESGEGFSIRVYKDPVDHGPAHSTAEPEPDHAGDLLGAAARDSDDDTEPDESESGIADNGLLDPTKLTDSEYIQALEDGTTWVQEGRQPFEVEPIDFEGDRYLEDLPVAPPSHGLAAKFQAWEQADDA